MLSVDCSQPLTSDRVEFPYMDDMPMNIDFRQDIEMYRAIVHPNCGSSLNYFA